MNKFVTTPQDSLELLIGTPWPSPWAITCLVVALIPALVCLLLKRLPPGDKHAPVWMLLLPFVWLLWQGVATAFSVSPELSRPTLTHFVACLVCFYAGYFVLGRVPSLALFWAFILAAFVYVLMSGWDQHFGGLEATRRYFYTYAQLYFTNVTPEYLKKMQSNRIFSTLFYPNALAGAMLLLFPPLAVETARFFRWLTLPSRVLLIALLAIGALGCLYWSGSKTGWLLMLLLALLALSQGRWSLRLKIAGLLLAVAGLAGFFIKHAGFFEKGATSLTARGDYWRAAITTARRHPLTGTGPGTFAIPYQAMKKPESEMARLTHNDYLEQASDSGLPGFILYAVFIGATVVYTFPGRWRLTSGDLTNPREPVVPRRGGPMMGATISGVDPRTFAIWLGVLGWCLQGLLEFGLYLPSLAWPAFACMGILWARASTQSP